MTIKARYPSQCAVCGGAIAPGDAIEWTRGSRARHTTCAGQTAGEHRIKRAARRYGSSYTRFSSGAEVFTNKRGRCEDAPCCGCCS